MEGQGQAVLALVAAQLSGTGGGGMGGAWADAVSGPLAKLQEATTLVVVMISNYESKRQLAQ